MSLSREDLVKIYTTQLCKQGSDTDWLDCLSDVWLRRLICRRLVSCPERNCILCDEATGLPESWEMVPFSFLDLEAILFDYTERTRTTGKFSDSSSS